MSEQAHTTLLNRRGQSMDGLARNRKIGLAGECRLASMLTEMGVRFIRDEQWTGRPDEIDFVVGSRYERWSVKTSTMGVAVLCAGQKDQVADRFVFFAAQHDGDVLRVTPLGTITRSWFFHYAEPRAVGDVIAPDVKRANGEPYKADYELFYIATTYLRSLRDTIREMKGEAA